MQAVKYFGKVQVPKQRKHCPWWLFIPSFYLPCHRHSRAVQITRQYVFSLPSYPFLSFPFLSFLLLPPPLSSLLPFPPSSFPFPPSPFVTIPSSFLARTNFLDFFQ